MALSDSLNNLSHIPCLLFAFPDAWLFAFPDACLLSFAGLIMKKHHRSYADGLYSLTPLIFTMKGVNMHIANEMRIGRGRGSLAGDVISVGTRPSWQFEECGMNN